MNCSDGVNVFDINLPIPRGGAITDGNGHYFNRENNPALYAYLDAECTNFQYSRGYGFGPGDQFAPGYQFTPRYEFGPGPEFGEPHRPHYPNNDQCTIKLDKRGNPDKMACPSQRSPNCTDIYDAKRLDGEYYWELDKTICSGLPRFRGNNPGFQGRNPGFDRNNPEFQGPRRGGRGWDFD